MPRRVQHFCSLLLVREKSGKPTSRDHQSTALSILKLANALFYFMCSAPGNQSNFQSGGNCIELPLQRELERTADLENFGVPILMYHRVATDGPQGLGRFRVAPSLFDEQLCALKQAGFRSIDLNHWVEALSSSEALPGKPLVLTFDDGYRDFLTAALPALRRYSFAATAFVVSGRIGGVADWDLYHGEVAPLMSWEELRTIGNEGVELGCHSLIHKPMTEMDQADLLTQTEQAREMLDLSLDWDIRSFTLRTPMVRRTSPYETWLPLWVFAAQ